jgi:hypothetical protein
MALPLQIRLPTAEEVEAARNEFRGFGPDLFYRAATELIDLSIRKVTRLSVPEALGVLLKTWNNNFYRFRGGFSEGHLSDIENLVNCHREQIAAFRLRSIESLAISDEAVIVSIFSDFEKKLGPVGSAKCLHLLAPRFFPLWDREISRAYGICLEKGPRNAALYFRFMGYTKQQCDALGMAGETYPDLLKAIDEYNYCSYTLKPKKPKKG